MIHNHYHNSTRRIRSIRLSLSSQQEPLYSKRIQQNRTLQIPRQIQYQILGTDETHTRSKSKLTAPICFKQKVALNAKRESYRFRQTKRQLLFPPLDPIQRAILTISIIWAGYMATHSSFLYFYGLLSSLIDRVWLFNLTATPLRAGWLYDNGWSWPGIGWNFLVIQLDFPENREI